MDAWRRPPMPTMGKHTLLLALFPALWLTAPLACAQSTPMTDLPMRPPPPPDTTLTRQQADQGRAAMIAPLKISFGKKSQEWTADKLAQLPHETIQTTNERTKSPETYSGVPLMALLVELGVPQK